MIRSVQTIGAIALLLVSACSSSPLAVEIEPAATASVDVRADVGSGFQIRAGEVAEVGEGGLRIAFRGVSSDSRCPEEVTCVWAGDAALQLGFSTGGADWSWTTLHTGLDPRSARHGGFSITVVGLTPAARQGGEIGVRDYVAELRVDRE